MYHFTKLIAPVFAVLMVAIPALRADSTKPPLTDAQFVLKASAAGLAEVKFAQLALKRAQGDEVKKFAQHMIKDHTKANDKLKTIAESEKYALSTTMDPKHQELYQKLTGLTGADFDREYLLTQVKDHEKAVALFEQESQNGQNKKMKEFAVKTLPTLREHLELVRKLNDEEKKK